MRSLLLSNPNSTSSDSNVLRSVLAILGEATHIDSRFTTHAGHASEIVSGLTREDFDAVIVMGGDGTVNEVINGLLGDDPDSRPDIATLPRLGIIPTGSANVFVRALGFPNEPEHSAILLRDLLNADHTRAVPLGFIEDRWFCVNVGFGIDADVINRMERIRAHGHSATPWRYGLVGLGAWQRLRRRPPEITFWAETPEGIEEGKDLPIVVVSSTNPWTYAGPVPVVTNPDHSIESGLALYALSDVRGPIGLAALMRAMGLGPRTTNRALVHKREFRVDDIASLTLTSPEELNWQVDGEYAGKAQSLSLRSFPSAIEVLAPHTANSL